MIGTETTSGQHIGTLEVNLGSASSVSTTNNQSFNIHSSGTTTNINQWSSPEFLKAEEIGESIEMLYKQYCQWNNGYSIIQNQTQEERVFKIVFSCIDGKWNKSEPIIGKIILAKGEDYEFDE